jgi:hypothetical protein
MYKVGIIQEIDAEISRLQQAIALLGGVATALRYPGTNGRKNVPIRPVLRGLHPERLADWHV